MRTPYDTALRVAQRDLDRVSAAIGLAIDELRRIETAHIAIETALVGEARLAATDPHMTTERYFALARSQRARLERERTAAQAQVEDLRRQAVEVYGARAAIETAAGTYRDDAGRMLAATEQATLDDLSGARPVTRVARHSPRLFNGALPADRPAARPR